MMGAQGRMMIMDRYDGDRIAERIKMIYKKCTRTGKTYIKCEYPKTGKQREKPGAGNLGL
jgi:hypothetical protein